MWPNSNTRQAILCTSKEIINAITYLWIREQETPDVLTVTIDHKLKHCEDELLIWAYHQVVHQRGRLQVTFTKIKYKIQSIHGQPVFQPHQTIN